MRTISKIEIYPALAPVTRTFKFSSGSAGSAGDSAKLIYVKITDSEGTVGWGEGRPHPQWSYETPGGVVEAIRNYLAPALIGAEIWDRRGIHHRMHQAIGRGPSTGMPIAKAVLDIGVHDLCAKAAGVPLRCFLGGARENRKVDLSWTVAVSSEAEIASEIKAGQSAGFRHFNFKAGTHPALDRKVAGKVAEAAGPDGFVWADANQGLSLTSALDLCPSFRNWASMCSSSPWPPINCIKCGICGPGLPCLWRSMKAASARLIFFNISARGWSITW